MRARGLIVAAIGVLAAAPSCGSSSGGGSGAGDDGGASGSSGAGSGSGGSSGSGGGSGGSSSSGGSSGSGSGGGSSGGSSGSSGGSSGGMTGDSGSCLGSSMLGALGKNKLMVGGAMQPATAAMAPFDLQYVYISGGVAPGSGPCASCLSGCSNNWWGCWQDPSQPPGQYVTGFAATCAGESPAQVPMITYYQLLQSSGVPEGSAEVTQAAADMTFMARYLADWRFLLQQIGMTKALLHIEPDFWGYAEQTGGDPTTMPAAVASANDMDCSSQPNTIAGMGKCMIAMVRKYAPNAFVALHASAWSTNMDVAGNTDPSFDVAGEAKKTAAFLTACGADAADYVVVETSDRDAGYYTCQGRMSWWDDTNATLPNFHQDFAWVTALTEAMGKPALYWQTPLGNMMVPDVCPEPSSGTITWHDNRVDYFLTHMGELAAAHVIGAAFGAGAGDQTTPESDGGNLVAKAKAYYAAGGVSCQ